LTAADFDETEAANRRAGVDAQCQHEITVK